MHNINQNAIFIFEWDFFCGIMYPVEMRKFFAFFIAMIVSVVGDAGAANVTVKKASSVKKQDTGGIESITNGSLLPGVIGLVSNVSALKKQTEELKAECVPSSSEQAWLNNMVKEYAKTGAKTAEEMRGKKPACGGGEVTAIAVAQAGGMDEDGVCSPVFNEPGAIWDGYPQVQVVKYCPDLSDPYCADSKKKTESNFYKIFGMLDWGQEDFLVGESATFIKLVEKTEKCAPEKISARTREAYTNFIQQTITGAGQSQNTGGIYDAIGSFTQGGGGLGGIGSLAPAAIQFLDK